MPLALSPGVFMADVDGDLVFLDARRDTYSCIARGSATELRAQLHSGAEVTPDALTDELEAAGLVHRDPFSPGWTMLRRSRPVADFHQVAADLPISLRTIAALVAAGAIGLHARKRARIETWVTRPPRETREPQRTRAATLALQFDRLRPFVPRSGGCLANSIMLLAFLRWHGLEADWVFGVRTFPFEAHCWVEHEGVVLNDVAEHVAWFTPIASS